MPQASNLYQSPLLSQIAVDYKNRSYIADQVLTPVGVPKMLGQYLKWAKGATFKIPKTEMAQNGQANLLDVNAEKLPFTLATHALQSVIDPLERDQAPEAQVEAMKTIKLTNGLLLQREIAVAAQLCDPSVITNNDDLSGTDQWSDQDDSLPMNAVLEAADTLPIRPNTFICGRDVFSALRTHPQILNALRGVNAPGIASAQEIARLFDVDRVLVGDAFVDTAGDGLAEDQELIWNEAAGGGAAILCYVDPTPPSPLMDSPTLGYLPTLGGGGAGPSMRTFRWVDQNYGTGGGVTRVKVETAYGILISAPDMAFLWTSVLS